MNNVFSPVFKTKIRKCFFIPTRLHAAIAIALVVVWTVGVYMGSSTNVPAQRHSALKAIKDMCNVARQMKISGNAIELSKPSKEEDKGVSRSLTDVTLKSLRINPRMINTTSSLNTFEHYRKRLSICKFPEIDPFDPSMEKYLDRSTSLNCSSNVPNVVYIKNQEIGIDFKKMEEALAKTNCSGTFDFCHYKVLERKPEDDKNIEVIFQSAKFDDSIELSDFAEDIRVECFDTNNTVISRSYFTFMRMDPNKELVYNDSYKVHMDKNSPAETLSILMIGIDALAKQHFARAMPRTRNFLIKELGALEMNKHGKLGYSTFPNVLPLLSGRTIDELANDTKWKFNRWGWMDQINEAFVWSDARRLGYRTGLMLDVVHLTAFHYTRKGFNRKPVDHYMRPIVVDANDDPLMRKPDKNCFGDEPEITKLYDYWLQLLHHYNSTKTNQTPFFTYRLTHDDYNLAFAGDELYLKFLKDLKATNALNNTVIIWFSDHGERYGEIRDTFTGEIETNTPFLFFAFPPWFENKYPEVMRVFRTNQNRLTSHFDTYATIQDLLNFKGVVGPKGKLGELSISLFREIPLYRTCKDAQIPAEFCLCPGLSKANLAPGLDKYLGAVIKDKVNSILEKHAKRCHELTLKSVERILEEKFEGSDSDSETRNFRVSIVTEPGNAQFEARVSFDVGDKRAKVDGEILRTNMYRGQAECMDTAELRNYCYCITIEPA